MWSRVRGHVALNMVCGVVWTTQNNTTLEQTKYNRGNDQITQYGKTVVDNLSCVIASAWNAQGVLLSKLDTGVGTCSKVCWELIHQFGETLANMHMF